MKSSFRVLIYLNLVLMQSPLSAVAADSQLPDQILPVLKKLEEKDFLRVATCREFSNLILDMSGLPMIGKTGVIKGDFKREGIDRTGELASRPVFTDGITQARGPYRNVRIQAAPGAEKNQWDLTLTRTWAEGKSRLNTVSKYSFQVVESPTQSQECQLISLAFASDALNDKTSRSPASKLPKSLALNGPQCMQLASSANESGQSPQSKAYIFLQKDCADGVPYFQDLKARLQEKSR